jgi:hypothetical protein
VVSSDLWVRPWWLAVDRLPRQPSFSVACRGSRRPCTSQPALGTGYRPTPLLQGNRKKHSISGSRVRSCWPAPVLTCQRDGALPQRPQAHHCPFRRRRPSSRRANTPRRRKLPCPLHQKLRAVPDKAPGSWAPGAGAGGRRFDRGEPDKAAGGRSKN